MASIFGLSLSLSPPSQWVSLCSLRWKFLTAEFAENYAEAAEATTTKLREADPASIRKQGKEALKSSI